MMKHRRGEADESIPDQSFSMIQAANYLDMEVGELAGLVDQHIVPAREDGSDYKIMKSALDDLLRQEIVRHR